MAPKKRVSQINAECQALMISIPPLLVDLKEGQTELGKKIQNVDEAIRGNGKEGLVARVTRLETANTLDRQQTVEAKELALDLVKNPPKPPSPTQWWYAPIFGIGASILIWFFTQELPKIIAHIGP